MPFSKFDRPTRARIEGALDLAWSALSTDKWTVARVIDTKAKLREQLVTAANYGERGAAKLVQAALQGIKR